MKRSPLVVALLLLSVAGCGHATGGRASLRAGAPTVAAPVPSASPAPSAAAAKPGRRHREHLSQPIALPSCPGTGHSPHFTTPEAAMTYLAAAWNRNDLDALCHVTNPNARFLLNDMHREAVNLRLKRCIAQDDGGYECVFQHDYPPRMHKHGVGHASFDVGRADTPGFYMTIFNSCG